MMVPVAIVLTGVAMIRWLNKERDDEKDNDGA